MPRNPFADARQAESAWDAAKGLEQFATQVTGRPSPDQEAAYCEYGPYGEVEVFCLKDGGAVTCYTPTMRYLRWRSRGLAFRYARAMGARAGTLARLLGE